VMPILAKRIRLFCIAFLIAYLVGSFMNASLNISTWEASARGFVGIAGATLGVIFACAPKSDFT